jgi:hypothetical protein
MLREVGKYAKVPDASHGGGGDDRFDFCEPAGDLVLQVHGISIAKGARPG